MNRKEKRQYIRNIKGIKGLRKNSTIGAFGVINPKASQQLDLRVIPKSKCKGAKTLQEAFNEVQAKTTENNPKIEENCQKPTVSDKKEVE